MHLISSNFLIFAVAFFAIYFLLNKAGQHVLLIVASYAFVCVASLWMAAILFFSTAVNFAFSRKIEQSSVRQPLLAYSIIFNILVLGIFKYYGFFTSAISDLFNLIGITYSPYTIGLAAPLGLSFYTFQAISHQVDLSRNRVKSPTFTDFALYMAFWPKFVAGPIIRSRWFLPQLRTRKRFSWPNLFLGVEFFVYGLFLKVALSDNLLSQIDRVFEHPKSYDGANTLVSTIFFTFQIYGDFAGYSLMVIGLARVMGFSVRRNFNRPNLARSFSDFWARWHISLSTWLEDYVFRSLIPRKALGGNQKWASVLELYSAVLRRPVQDHDTFEALAGDSLSYVEVALGLEDLIGNLPSSWERLSVKDLEALCAPEKVALA